MARVLWRARLLIPNDAGGPGWYDSRDLSPRRHDWRPTRSRYDPPGYAERWLCRPATVRAFHGHNTRIERRGPDGSTCPWTYIQRCLIAMLEENGTCLGLDPEHGLCSFFSTSLPHIPTSYSRLLDICSVTALPPKHQCATSTFDSTISATTNALFVSAYDYRHTLHVLPVTGLTVCILDSGSFEMLSFAPLM